MVGQLGAPAGGASAPIASPPGTAPLPAMQPPAPAPAPAVLATGVTYHKDIRSVLETRCIECHGGKVEDRIGPFSLDSWQAVSEAVKTWPVVDTVVDGHMPPWPAAADCRPIADNRALPPETRALFTAWEKAGFPEGDPATYVAPVKERAVVLGQPSLVLKMTQNYMPRRNDEYTCFGLADESGQPYTFPERKFMVAVQVLPGKPSEVHHVQLHRTSGRPAAGPVDCGGFTASVENMFSWRPGSTPLVYPDGGAANIPQGAGFNIQVHYNATFAKDGPQPDNTRVAFWFLKEGTPKSVITREAVQQTSFVIGAGNPSVRAGSGISVPAGVDIVGISPHAHMLATEMSATATVGGMRACLINIPKWDYHWQLDYTFTEPLSGPAQVSTSCVWDNSAEHQPTVNGMQLQPRNVSFGEGSFDEMCLHYVWLRRPFTQ